MRCTGLGEDGLVGESLGVAGLGPNQASAMEHIWGSLSALWCIERGLEALYQGLRLGA